MKRLQRGFSMIELMMAVAVIGVLTAIAVPSYKDYVTRGRVVEAFSSLGGVQINAEQFWSNNRTFVGFNSLPANTANFTYALSGATASAYVVTATGIGKAAGFVYTINQSGARSTTGVPSGWTASSTCWVDRKDGSCSQ